MKHACLTFTSGGTAPTLKAKMDASARAAASTSDCVTDPSPVFNRLNSTSSCGTSVITWTQTKTQYQHTQQ